ncbi:MAG: hypothetical protein ACK2U0_07510 [Candidatus Promineifilaceae bacterium]
MVVKAAQKCIAIAASLSIRSIAFLPWGTRVGASEAAHITALMIQALASALKYNAGNLEQVYLVSKNEIHYQWFVDRAFLFHLMNSQINDIREQIRSLDLSSDVQRRILDSLGNLSQTFIFANEVIGHDKISMGDIHDASGITLGAKSAAVVNEKPSH